LVYNVFDYDNLYKLNFYLVSMKLFMPSKNVLEKICSQGNPLVHYDIYVNKEKDYSVFITGLFSEICNFYRIGLNEVTKSRLSFQKVIYVYSEAIKNWVDHAPKESDLVAGLFLGDFGVCYGFKDKGNYFKNKKIKYQYENKIEITEFDQNTLKTCCQSGVNEYLYPNSDIIEVDSKKGVLYCVQFKKNIIAPEGEEGNSYFFKRDKGKGF